jgi:hypothetical protein
METLWMDGFAENDPLQNIPSKRAVRKILVFKELRWGVNPVASFLSSVLII